MDDNRLGRIQNRGQQHSFSDLYAARRSMHRGIPRLRSESREPNDQPRDHQAEAAIQILHLFAGVRE